MKLFTLMQSTRLPFLILTPVCVFLGAAVSIYSAEAIDYSPLPLVIAGALLAHIAVNTFNEHYDFKSGLDLITDETPFSGGSGALPDNPEAANEVLLLASLTMLATVAIGLYLAVTSGLGIIPIGLLGLLLIAAYTGWITKHPLLCLVAPGTGFGFLMVIGTQYVLTADFLPLSALIALVPFFLVNNLLLLNQYPDINADKAVGRYHLPIAYGTHASNIVYAVFALAAALAISLLVVFNILPLLSLVALLPLLLAGFALSGAIKHQQNIGHSPQYLAANVATTILTPLILGVSLIL